MGYTFGFINRGRVLLLAALMLLLPACSEGPQQALRMGSSPWPGYEPWYLARDIGLLDQNKVQLFELPSADITMESFRNRSTDLARLTLDETLELVQDGTKLRIVQILDISNGADAVLAKPEIKKLADLRGKRIAIVNIPLGLYLLNRMLEKAGITRDEVEVFPMSESKHVEFYQQGLADVVITFDPVKTKLEALGMHVIFDSSKIPNEIIDLLVVHEDVYMTRQDEICAITQQWDKALTYMRNNKKAAHERISKRLRISEEAFEKSLAGLILASKDINHKMLAGDSPDLVPIANRLAEIMLHEKQLTERVDIKANHALDIHECHTI